MRSRILIALACLLLSAQGCASILASKKREIPINSDPPGAEVLVDGTSYGRTPLKIRFRHGRDYNLTLRMDGRRDRTYTMRSRVEGGWVVLDLLCGFLPALIDASTQAWRQLDVYSVHAPMDSAGTNREPVPLDDGGGPYVSVVEPTRPFGKGGIDLPITIELDGGVRFVAQGIQPQGMGSFKVDLGSGNVRFIDGSKIKRIVSANRVDLTSAVLEGKRRIP